MSTTLKRDLEQAIKTYLIDGDSALASYQVLVSRDADSKRLPRARILVTNMQVAEGFEGTGAGEYTATVAVQLDLSADDSLPRDADSFIEAFESKMEARSDLIDAIHDDTNSRIYAHDCNLNSMEEDSDERGYYRVYNYTMPIYADNS